MDEQEKGRLGVASVPVAGEGTDQPTGDPKDKRTEEFRLSGGEVLDKVKSLIHEANVRRIILKNEEGKVYLEIPLALGMAGGVVGVFLLPVIAAVGALVAVVTRVVLVVERTAD
jgi:hypothetical protein